MKASSGSLLTLCRFHWPSILAPLRATLATVVLALGLGPLVANGQTCVPNTTADWMSTNAASVFFAQAVAPIDCAVVQQTPPDFRWPDVISIGGYSLTLTYPDGNTRTLAAAQNWINWDEILPAGTYSWTVGYSGGATSARRTFIVDGNSMPFLAPDMNRVLSELVAKPHPRSLPDPATFFLIKLQRSGAISALLRNVSARISEILPATGGSTQADAYHYSDHALSALMACAYSGQDSYCNDAIRRVMNLAAWDPRGPISYLNSAADMGARKLTWALAVGYDWLYPRLSASQRTQLLNVLRIRNGDMYSVVIGSRAHIAMYPRDSHGNQSLNFLALISVLLVGDLAEANTWLANSLPLSLNAISPWSGEEGGYANSTTQGNWDLGENLRLWNQLRYATGIDVTQKPRVRNWARYIAYFTPPGMVGGTTAFGDGFESDQSYDQARYGIAYTYFSPSPLGRWYAAKFSLQDTTSMDYLMAPPADFSGAQPFPAGTPNSLLLSTIGQVAMHSDLSNNARTSVYFKSSPPPFGAYNHSHADQNSFVINSGGRRLAIETGYYDGYHTDHWLNWYHRTKAKNAITYDGGQGQLLWDDGGGKTGFGQVTNFFSSPTADIVSGDATAAYGGALTKAQRSLVYLRPNLILVYDNLASATARQWEWNIHAINQMTVVSDTQISIQNSGQTLCVKMLAGPSMRFSQTNLWSNPPNGSYPAQWHGNFYSTTRLPRTEFIALLNVGCTPVTVGVRKFFGTWTIAVDDFLVVIDAMSNVD